MPRTASETTIIQKRKSRRRGYILVSLLEDIMRRPLEMHDAEDRQFMADLIEHAALPRYKEIISPSSMADCLRKVYFARTGQVRKFSPNLAASGYFLDGHFRHLKWQFALFKLHRAGKIRIPIVYHQEFDHEWFAIEWRVMSKHEDFGGTLDGMIEIPFDDVWEPFIVDFKGMHTQSFIDYTYNGTPLNYKHQIVGYAMLVPRPWKIKRCLLVAENKNGSDRNGSALGLHEDVIVVEQFRPEVKERLEVVRRYEEGNTIPPPACESTQRVQFQGCPFKWFCRGEVADIEQQRKEAARRNPKKPRVAVPHRTRARST